jgi:hypothetical protein
MNVVPNIQEIHQKLKSFEELSDIRVGILILLVALGSFWLGTESGESTSVTPITVHEEASAVTTTIVPLDTQSNTLEVAHASGTEVVKKESKGSAPEGGYVASKNGGKYHLPWCSGALRIKEENKVWFKTKEEAEKAGYTPASNCKGI